MSRRSDTIQRCCRPYLHARCEGAVHHRSNDGDGAHAEGRKEVHGVHTAVCARPLHSVHRHPERHCMCRVVDCSRCWMNPSNHHSHGATSPGGDAGSLSDSLSRQPGADVDPAQHLHHTSHSFTRVLRKLPLQGCILHCTLSGYRPHADLAAIADGHRIAHVSQHQLMHHHARR